MDLLGEQRARPCHMFSVLTPSSLPTAKLLAFPAVLDLMQSSTMEYVRDAR